MGEREKKGAEKLVTSSSPPYSPTSDGSAAAVLCSEDFVRRHGLQGQAVEILAMELATDLPSTFEEGSCMKMVRHIILILELESPSIKTFKM